MCNQQAPRAEADEAQLLSGRGEVPLGKPRGEEAACGGEGVSYHAGVKSHSYSREKKSQPPTLSSLWSGCLGKSPFRTRSS